MKKRTKILIIIASVWTLIVIVDLIAVNILGRPLLCISLPGGDMTSYIGIGYNVDVIYPFAAEGETSSYFNYSAWLYAVGISILVIFIMYDIVKMRKSKGEKQIRG